jgi:predicted Zn-dependent protease
MYTKERFHELADAVCSRAGDDEVLLARLEGERSDFVRLNQSKVRQAGRVEQAYLSLELIRGRKHLSAEVGLCGNPSDDLDRADALINDLRGRIDDVPDDPHLLFASEVHSSEQVGDDRLPEPEQALAQILAAGRGRDLVGIYAAGAIVRAFANSLGQRNWFESHTFHFDWCYYLQADKAVKSSYAGFAWDDEAFARKVDDAGRQLEALARPARTIEPGEVRVYLAPAAMVEVLEMLAWGGFGLKDHKTKATPLLKMIEDGATMHPSVTIRENTADGMAQNFQAEGFLRPDCVTLIEAGACKDCLVSPRSAKEYHATCNGAAEGESPRSMDVSAGDVPADEVLSRLDTGVYVNQLWYLNYSDRPACRMTGMTRFATFWVEGGRIVAPLSVMRFDETAYRMLGENLIGLTGEREFLPSSSTYGGRSVDSVRTPGALIENFRFTL